MDITEIISESPSFFPLSEPQKKAYKVNIPPEAMSITLDKNTNQYTLVDTRKSPAQQAAQRINRYIAIDGNYFRVIWNGESNNWYIHCETNAMKPPLAVDFDDGVKKWQLPNDMGMLGGVPKSPPPGSHRFNFFDPMKIPDLQNELKDLRNQTSQLKRRKSDPDYVSKTPTNDQQKDLVLETSLKEDMEAAQKWQAFREAENKYITAQSAKTTAQLAAASRTPAQIIDQVADHVIRGSTNTKVGGVDGAHVKSAFDAILADPKVGGAPYRVDTPHATLPFIIEAKYQLPQYGQGGVPLASAAQTVYTKTLYDDTAPGAPFNAVQYENIVREVIGQALKTAHPTAVVAGLAGANTIVINHPSYPGLKFAIILDSNGHPATIFPDSTSTDAAFVNIPAALNKPLPGLSSWGWGQDDMQNLSAEIRKKPATSAEQTPWSRYWVIPLQNDATTSRAAANLYTKHYANSSLFPWNADYSWNEINCINWDPETQSVMSQKMAPLKKGDTLKIVLVGHGSGSGEQVTFGGRSIGILESDIGDMLSTIAPDTVTDIRLDLVGCNLTEGMSAPEYGLPWKLGDLLIKRARELNIPLEGMTVSARSREVRINAQGKKEYIINGQWVTKEALITAGNSSGDRLQILEDEMYKVVLVWDSKEQKLVRQPLSTAEISDMNNDIFRLQHDVTQSQHGKIDKLSHYATWKSLEASVFERPSQPKPEYRSDIETKAIVNAESFTLARRWQNKTEEVRLRLINAGVLKGNANDWVPLLTGEELEFTHRSTGEVRKSAVKDKIFAKFSGYVKTLVKSYTKAVDYDARTQRVTPKSAMDRVNVVNSLNAATLIGNLFALDEISKSSHPVSDAVKLEVYAGLVNGTLGVVQDAGRVGKNILLGLDRQINLLKLGSPLSKGFLLGGLVLDAASIGALIWQLKQTDDPIKRAVINASITTTALNMGMTLAPFIFKILGLAKLAGIAGGIALPVGGVLAGIPGLVQAYREVSHNFDRAGTYFDTMLKITENPGFHQNGELWQLPDLVVTEIDFVSGKLHYGNVRVSSTRDGTGHTVTGGWDHYATRPDPDSRYTLDVYEGLGFKKTHDFTASGIGAFIVPTALNSTISVDYNQVFGKRDDALTAYRKLRAYYGDKFIWGMYVPPGDLGIDTLHHNLQNTSIRINLDKTERTLIFPTVQGSERQQLSYFIQGNGGIGNLILPAEPVKITLSGSQRGRERWVLDIDALVKNYQIKEGKLEFAALKENVFSHMKTTADSLVIGGQTILFHGTPPRALLLNYSIVSGITLVIDVDLAKNQRKAFILMDAEMISMDSMTKIQRHFASQDLRYLVPQGTIPIQSKTMSGILELPQGISEHGGKALFLQTNSQPFQLNKLHYLHENPQNPGVSYQNTLMVRFTGNVPAAKEGCFLIQGNFTMNSYTASQAGAQCFSDITAKFDATMAGNDDHWGQHRLILKNLSLEIPSRSGKASGEEQALVSFFNFLTRERAALFEWLPVHLQLNDNAFNIDFTDDFSIRVYDGLKDYDGGRGRSFDFLPDETGKLHLSHVSWKRGTNSYEYSKATGALHIVASETAERLDVLEADRVITGSPVTELLIMTTPSVNRLYIDSTLLTESKIAIVTELKGARSLQIETGGKAPDGFHWKRDGADLLFTDLSGKAGFKLLNIFTPTTIEYMEQISFKFSDLVFSATAIPGLLNTSYAVPVSSAEASGNDSYLSVLTEWISSLPGLIEDMVGQSGGNVSERRPEPLVIPDMDPFMRMPF